MAGEIGGEFEIWLNCSLGNFTGFENTTSIGEILSIGNNENLISLTGLDNLTTIGGDLFLYSNDALTNITGLASLASIGGSLAITDNNSLASIQNLYNLTSIGAQIILNNNDVLNNLTGLNNIDSSTITGLYILNNNLLSHCEAKSICDYLAIPGGTIDIHDNAHGCNSQEEVEVACDTLSILDKGFNLELTISPNPLHTQAKIEIVGAIHELTLHNNQIIEFYLFDFLGREVFRTIITSSPYILKRQGLPNGMYIWKAVGITGITTGKLVIE